MLPARFLHVREAASPAACGFAILSLSKERFAALSLYP
jgi:hypothetical protein